MEWKDPGCAEDGREGEVGMKRDGLEWRCHGRKEVQRVAAEEVVRCWLVDQFVEGTDRTTKRCATASGLGIKSKFLSLMIQH